MQIQNLIGSNKSREVWLHLIQTNKVWEYRWSKHKIISPKINKVNNQIREMILLPTK